MLLTEDSAQPFVQIGNQAFEGSYQETLGTSLFFSQEQEPDAATHDPVFGRDSKISVTYLAAARKKLWLKRVFLKERPGASEKDLADRTGHVGEVSSDSVTAAKQKH
jgi:hypothetical protein